MVMYQKIRLLGAAGLLTLASASTVAATSDGSLGSTSTGTVDITATISDHVRVTGLVANGAMAFGDITSVATNQIQTADICIYRTDSANYYVTLSGDGGYTGGTGFLLGNDTTALAGDDLAYSVRFSDDSGTTYTSVTAASQLTTPDNADTSDDTCSSSTNAQIEVTITSANVSSAAVGSYTGVLTIVVTPET